MHMRMTPAFKKYFLLLAVPLTALALAPLLRYAIYGWHRFPRGYTTFWATAIEHYFSISPLVTVIVYTIAMGTVLLWFRKPAVSTASLMYFSIVVVCGLPGGAVLTALAWSF
jgi:hypothetical protein